MRTILLATALVASTACAGVHGSGVIRSESRKIQDFEQIDVSGGLAVTVRTGPTSLTIEGDDNLVALYRTEVKDGRLVIAPKDNVSLNPTREIKVTVTTPRLSRVEASGGVDVLIEATTEKNFELDLSGGVELKAAALELESLKLEASGGVTLDVGGRAHNAVIDLSGGVHVRGKGLEVANAKLDASGGCEVEMKVTEAIVGSASGGVDVTVYGNPPKSRLHTSGGADVSFKD